MKYIETEKRDKRIKRIAVIAVSVLCAVIIFFIVLNIYIVPNRKYNDAIALMDEGRYTEAISIFEKLDGYKDSNIQIEQCYISIYGEEVWHKVKNVDVGDTYTFGSYEQDNNISNGKESIDWEVLAKEGTKILVISEYALDCQPYNLDYTDVTWDTCTLRKWLNNDFINDAFSDAEKAMIPTITVSADVNPGYSTDPGNATQDKIFLLSVTEALMYYTHDGARQYKATDYAAAQGTSQGAIVSNSNGNCNWWLRSPGYSQNEVAYVCDDGEVYLYGGSVSSPHVTVRPALWIDLNT